MPVDNLPSITAEADHGTVTLGELRELVEAAALLPPDSIVRGNLIPFKMADLGNTKGGSLRSIAIDRAENV